MVAQTKVFVGRLPEDAKPEDLRKLFERFGVVTECDIMNRCGFVHMETEEQAAAAIRELHNTTFNGGVITVERGRIKERGQRGGGRGMRGGMRGGMDRRGGMRGGMRDAPYPMRDRGMGPMRDRGMGHMRNSAPYDRSMDRGAMGGGGYDDRYNGYGGEDRRGFALMDNRGARDPYAAPPPMYADDRQGYGAPVDNMYPDERDMMDRRAPMRSAPMTMSAGYDRAPPRAAPMTTDMYSRRSEQTMWGGAAAAGSYERDPYAQQYPNAGRSDGYGGEGARDPYAAPPPMHADDRQSYAAPVDGAYPDERSMVDRRAPVAPRAAPVPADAYSRKSEQAMWGDAAAAGSYERDPYAQQYPNAGRILVPG